MKVSFAMPTRNAPAATCNAVQNLTDDWTGFERVFGGLMFAPTAQLIIDPALDPTRNCAWALSLRTTLLS